LFQFGSPGSSACLITWFSRILAGDTTGQMGLNFNAPAPDRRLAGAAFVMTLALAESDSN
jgi:hypothetical protein